MTDNANPAGVMRDYTYEILFRLEETHWWLASRRLIVLDWVRRRYPGRNDLRILDVGCGTGLMMRDMADMGTVDGVDIADEAVQYCRQRGVENVTQASVVELPFPDRQFDVVTGVDILEHIEDDVAALREWRRVLKPGGRLYLFVPAHKWLWSLQDEISGHQRRYTERGLRQVLSEAGLTVERQSYVSTYLLPMIFVGRLWLKVMRRFREYDTENTLHPAWSNGILGAIFRAEIPVLRRFNMPVGASILCVATNP